MKLLLLNFLFAAFLFADIDSIMYGRYISIEEAPYFISLLDQNMRFDCGGAIISEYYVLTAAHCVRDGLPKRIIAGPTIKNELNANSVHNVSRVFIPGDCVIMKREVPSTDIALVKLKSPIEFNKFKQPIRIRTTPPRHGDVLTITGFGNQGNAKAKNTPVLKQTQVAVMSEKICDVYTPYLRSLGDGIFCAGNGTTDSCSGDSGGPAVIDGQLAGIVSFGPPCLSYKYHPHFAAAYTRVDKYYEWILKITGIAY